MTFEHIFIIAFVLLVSAFFLYRIIKYGGLRGAMFGAPVRQILSKIELETPVGGQKTKLKICLLDTRGAPDVPHVGLEITWSRVGAWQMKPILLTKTEAQWFAEQLTLAANVSHLTVQ
jgi:hypothetical protein